LKVEVRGTEEAGRWAQLKGDELWKRAQELIEKGLLEWPTWVLEESPEKRPQFEQAWLETFSGQGAVLTATLREMKDAALAELSGPKRALVKVVTWIAVKLDRVKDRWHVWRVRRRWRREMRGRND
jgi:hypothetical protein